MLSKNLKNLQLFENWNDIMSTLMFATQIVNKVKMKQIIEFMRNHESAF